MKIQERMGVDAEIFLQKNDGQFITADTVLPRQRKGVYIYHDGRQAEFSTRIESCREIMVGNIAELLHTLSVDVEMSLIASPQVYFSPEALEKGGPWSFRSGCKPAMDGFNCGDMTPGLGDAYKSDPLGYAGFHVHVDVPPSLWVGLKNKLEFVNLVARNMAFQTLLWEAISPFDEAARRRAGVGQPAEYRMYETSRTGVIELRSISGGALHCPEYCSIALALARLALNSAVNGVDSSKGVEDKILETLFSGEKDLAGKLWLSREDGSLSYIFESSKVMEFYLFGEHKKTLSSNTLDNWFLHDRVFNVDGPYSAYKNAKGYQTFSNADPDIPMEDI